MSTNTSRDEGYPDKRRGRWDRLKPAHRAANGAGAPWLRRNGTGIPNKEGRCNGVYAKRNVTAGWRGALCSARRTWGLQEHKKPDSGEAAPTIAEGNMRRADTLEGARVTQGG